HLAVVVHVPQGDRIGADTGGELDLGAEGSVALAFQNAHRPPVIDAHVGHVDVQLPVAVQIPQRDRLRLDAGRIAHAGREAPLAVAQQHAGRAAVAGHRVVVGVGGHDVQPT